MCCMPNFFHIRSVCVERKNLDRDQYILVERQGNQKDRYYLDSCPMFSLAIELFGGLETKRGKEKKYLSAGVLREEN